MGGTPVAEVVHNISTVISLPRRSLGEGGSSVISSVNDSDYARTGAEDISVQEAELAEVSLAFTDDSGLVS